MHSWIQNHILLELTKHSVRRNSELRPRDVEGNLFAYHLKGLMSEGLVEKQDGGYGLSVKGKQFAGTYSLKTGRTRMQPKILTVIVCQNEQGDYLFARWHRQPNIGQVSFVHGMMHFGVSVYEMAATELAEKAGLEAEELVYRGEVYVIGMRGEQVDRHMLVHIFEARNVHELTSPPLRPEVSESFWAPLASLHPDMFVPGFYEIAQLLQSQSSGRLFEEVTVTITD